jgi:hypothetical protein
MTHGIFAQMATIVGGGAGAEAVKLLRQIFAALCQDLQPVGCTETMLVQRIAVNCWRMQRLLLVEVRMAPKHPEGQSGHVLSVPRLYEFDTILKTETTLERSISRNLEALLNLQKMRQVREASVATANDRVVDARRPHTDPYDAGSEIGSVLEKDLVSEPNRGPEGSSLGAPDAIVTLGEL